MKIFETTDSLEKIDTSLVLTIGNFDGLHLGHRQILNSAKATASRYGASGLALMTFHPHPAAILHPQRAPRILTPLVLKQKLLVEAGVDFLIVIKDEYQLLTLSPGDFIDKFVQRYIRPAAIVEGSNFNFGYGRSGNVETLKQLADEHNFGVVIAESVRIKIESENVVCSSSRIRDLLDRGQVGHAASMLGRNYKLIGKTVPGRGVGRRLGFPTANIEPLEQVIPAEGVYAGFVQVGQELEDVCQHEVGLPAAFSIGRAKTFVTDHPMLIEAHLLDTVPSDLAGKWLAMDFVKRIRGQIRFDSEEKLKARIADDCRQAKKILAS
jgi:riboflavin kinase / FMN adenylyltransferase